MLTRVRIPDGQSVYDRYAHQLSGGMQQRVSIAMALSIDPKLLILDEPTTGLDATVEAEILDLIAQLRREMATAVLFISHNLAVISRMCDRVGVLYAGALIEEGPTAEIFGDPRHPYTVGLLRCLPRPGRRKDHGRLDSIPGSPPTPDEDVRGCLFAARCGLAEEKCRSVAPPFFDLGAGAADRRSRCHFHARAQALARLTPDDQPAAGAADRSLPPMLEATGLSKSFGGGRHPVRALHAVSLRMWPGETLGLVGESGSGKTTLARVLLGLVSPDPGGVIALDGTALAGDSRARRADERKSLQIVFQNPDSALNRSHTLRRLIGRVLARLGRVPRAERKTRLLELILPNRVEVADPSRPIYLDEAAIESPSIALNHAAREALRMVDVLDSMIEGAASAFRRPDRRGIARSRRLDDVLDALNGEIKHYVMQLDPEGLSDEEHRRLEAILAFSLNLESGGDVIERNILPLAAKQMKRGVELSDEAEAEIEATFQAARSNLGAAASIFMTGDLRAARALIEQKREFRRREADALRAHLARLRKSDVRQALPLDLLRDIKRLNDHLVAGAADPVLEASGALLASRISEGSG